MTDDGEGRTMTAGRRADVGAAAWDVPPRADEAVGADEPSVGPLLELAVADLALIERVRLPFAPGFNVLTGETGAGKSLLIDALGLATAPGPTAASSGTVPTPPGWKPCSTARRSPSSASARSRRRVGRRPGSTTRP